MSVMLNQFGADGSVEFYDSNTGKKFIILKKDGTVLCSTILSSSNVFTGANAFTGANTHTGAETHAGVETHSGAETWSGRPVFNASIKMPKTLAVTATNISGSLAFDCYEVSAATTISLFLPTASDGAIQKIYNRGATGVVTIDPMASATINGASSVKLSGATSWIELRGKSTNWRIVGRSTALLV